MVAGRNFKGIRLHLLESQRNIGSNGGDGHKAISAALGFVGKDAVWNEEMNTYLAEGT